MRPRLPRVKKECAREGCHNTFEVKLGSKSRYQRKYCSQRCAALATRKSRERRRRKRKYPVGVESNWVRKRIFSIVDLQNCPVNLGFSDGGRFAEICEEILEGKSILIGNILT